MAIAIPTSVAYDIVEGVADCFVVGEDTGYRGDILICSNEEQGRTLQDSVSVIAIATLRDTTARDGAFCYSVENPIRLIEVPFRVTGRLEKYSIPEAMIMPYPEKRSLKRLLNYKPLQES